MNKVLQTSVAPYFDTFNTDNGFHQVLFKPARPVQVREVNELQSILQNQVEQFANHVFEFGSKVTGGEINCDMNAKYITVEGMEWVDLVNYLAAPDVLLKSETREVSARISYYTRDESGDPITLYLKYLTGDTDSNIFNVGENIVIQRDAGDYIGMVKCSGNGEGSIATVNTGYYYINGYFVYTPDQYQILSKYSSTPSKVLGFVVEEQIITSAEDARLLDNANSTTNFNAIGADRLKINLRMVVKDEGEVFDRRNFVQLALFKEGILQEVINRTDYSAIRDEAARRDFDAHGNYTISAFNLFTEDNKQDSSKYVVGVEAGKAYVKGYEIEKLVTTFLESDKARDSIGQTNQTMQIDLGAYITVKDYTTIPDVNLNREVEFFSAANKGGSVVGSAVVRQFRIVNGESRLYIGQMKNPLGEIDTSFISRSRSVQTKGGTNAFTANNAESSPVLYGTRKDGLIYKLANENIKTLLKPDGSNDTFLTVARQFKARSGTDSLVTISVAGAEVFAPIDDNAIISYGGQVKKLSELNPTYNPNMLTINVGGPSVECVIISGVVKRTSVTRNKIRTTNTLVIQTPKNKTTIPLGAVDVVSTTRIMQDNKDISHMFTLDTGTTSDYYDQSKLVVKPGETITKDSPITIDMVYFQHSSGDYFSVDSYSNIDYEDIPSFEGVKLSDALDFRPTIFKGSMNDLPMSNTLTTSDVVAYLPRIDKVVLASTGEFSIVNGVSALDPIEPETPDNTMVIYTLVVPPYTVSAKDISIRYVDNRRYTMRDIGKLDNRLTRLEEAYTLTLLEVETDAMQVSDASTGLNRYKNGFFVDSYTSHINSRWADTGYKCSISRTEGVLRPEFSMDAVDYVFDGVASSGVKVTGDLVTLDYSNVSYLNQNMASSTINVNPYAVLTWDGSLKLFPSSDIWFDSVYTKPEVHYEVYNNGKLSQSWDSWELNWTGGSSNSTTRSSNSNGDVTTTRKTEVTDVKMVNDRVVDTNVVPFMREKDINIEGKGFMPYSKLYAFFDNINVTEYCTTAPFLTVGVDGNIKFTFKLPNNDKHRFRSGTKLFKLIDNDENNDIKASTSGEVDFTSEGVIETRTQSINATKRITTTKSVQRSRGNDPVAQSFLVKDQGGVFITSVDVFFKTKDDVKPISLAIRDMDNGFPSLNVVPYSEVILNPVDVKISDDASLATTFKFESPVYLNQDAEYCFVLMTNSLGYNVWKATMGEVQVDKPEAISKQPFIGVMFKSQNNSTWSADQMSDLKFNITRAKFDVGTVGTAKFNSTVANTYKLLSNPISMKNGSTAASIKIDNHGLLKDDLFTLDNVTFSYLPVDLFNKQHSVVSVIDADNITFQVAAPATVDGSFGGPSIMSTRNMQVSIVHPIVQDMVFSNTSINYEMEMLRGQSLSGSENAYTTTGSHSAMINENNILMYPVVIPSEDNNTHGMTSKMKADMTTRWDNISPVIDINRVGLAGINNRVNFPASVADELTSNDGVSNARHISNIMQVAEPANSLRVIVDLCKPQDTDIKYFYRIGNTYDEVDNKAWAELPLQKGASVTKQNEYLEYTFSKNNLENYTFYQMKTILLSKSAANIPSAKRFRCLALGT